MKAVKFKISMSPYWKGEVAGFHDDIAQKIVDKGYAEYYVPEPKKEKPSPVKEQEATEDSEIVAKPLVRNRIKKDS